MNTRSAELSAFLKSLHSAIAERAHADSEVFQVTEKIMGALQAERPPASPEPAWLPACEFLNDAINNVVGSAAGENSAQRIVFDSSVVENAQALQSLAPRLAWWRRPNTAFLGKKFANSHANATVIGKGGLEERDDVCVGISLIAPGIQYPEHHHPPEEVYLVLSRGNWQKGGGDWWEPGIGGLVHNPPNVLHAMRSGSTPLLAIWCLWIDN